MSSSPMIHLIVIRKNRFQNNTQTIGFKNKSRFSKKNILQKKNIPQGGMLFY
jgi:hypothetical protein